MIADFFRVTPKKRTVRLKLKRGVLFSNPGIVGKTFFYTGTWLFTGGLLYGFYLYWPLGKAIVNYWQYKQKPVEVVVNRPTPVIPTPTIAAVVSTEYSITIPKINAYAKITKDVNPFDPKLYLYVLKDNSVAQAKGTDELDQGRGKSTYIFAHSTSQGLSAVRQNAVFYLLGELKNDDPILINDHGNIYEYKIYKQQIVGAAQTEFLNYKEDDKEIIILQTCWPIGTDWKRLLVFAERVRE